MSYTYFMSKQKPASRPRCERCQRPLSHCLCAHIPAVANQTQVLVLQHPDEAKHPLNTAKLAVLGLQNAQLWVGEYFPQLEETIASQKQAWLLFPAGDSACVQAEPGKHDNPSMLIVPDGTWRKARHIIRANPVLRSLPHLSLPPGAPSEYRVRRASEPAAVATIEALVRALEQVEPQQDFQPLLRPFRILVEQQIQAMGEEVYLRNHAR